MIQKKFTFVSLFLFLVLQLVAQSPVKTKKSTEKSQSLPKGNSEPTMVAEIDAQFVGGKKAFNAFIAERIQYPIQCQNASFVLQFVVDKIGQVTEIKAIEESANCETLVTNVTKILKMSPRWIPRLTRGQFAKSYHEISIKYDNTSSFVQIGELKNLEQPINMDVVKDPTMNNAVIHMDINQKKQVQTGSVEKKQSADEPIMSAGAVNDMSLGTETPVSSVHVKAKYPGGEAKFMEYFMDAFETPSRCVDCIDAITEPLNFKFVVSQKGAISNIELMPGQEDVSKKIPEIIDECIRVIKSSPMWIPGQINGKFVTSYANVSIDFRSNSNLETESKPVQPETGSMAEYPGGTNQFLEFIQKNLTYPQRCKDANIQGKILARFVVNLDGKISNVEILEHSYLCPEFSKEVTRVILRSPKWIPATINGKAVKSYQAVPIRFELEEK